MKKMTITLFAVAAMALTACGVDNVAACQDAYAKINALDCIGTELTVTCPDTLNEGGLDCTDFYTCFGDGYTCDGDTLNADVNNCPACS